MFLRIIFFLSADYPLCSKISKLFLQKEIEIQPYIPACSFLVFLFSGFPKSFGFYLTAYCILYNGLIFNSLNNSMILCSNYCMAAYP